MAKYVKTVSRNVPIKLLIANEVGFFPYNADSIRDLTSFGSLRTFTNVLFSKYSAILQT